MKNQAGSYRCILSRDSIRKLLLEPGDEYFSKEKQVFDMLIYQINYMVEQKTADIIYVDATHVSKASRAKILNRIKNRKDISLEVVDMRTPLAVCQARNHKRTGFAFVPPKAIYNMYKNYQKPTEEEFKKFGFHSVIIKEISWKE